MQHNRLALVALSCASIALFFSCASAPRAGSDSPAVAARLAEDYDLAHRHGAAVTEDPFVVPYQLVSGMIGGKIEFVTVALQLNLPEASRVSIDADIRADDGSLLASPYTAEQLKTFWSSRLNTMDSTLPRRIENINRFYIPSTSFQARKGSREYYLVLAGKMPIQRPSTVEVFVALGDETPQSFYFTLQAPAKK